MLGVVCLLHAVLCHLGRHTPPVSLQVEPDEREQAPELIEGAVRLTRSQPA